MPYQALIRLLTAIDRLPPKYHFAFAGFMGFASSVAEVLSKDSIAAMTGLVMAGVALVGAWRSLKREEEAEKRKTMLTEAQIQYQLRQFQAGQIAPIVQRIDMNEQGLKVVHKNQRELKASIKGLEDLRNNGLLVGPNPYVPSILIVDDDPSSIDILARFFVRNLGPFNLLKATDVDEAIKQVASSKPNWIFLDIKLGGRSGLEVIAPAKSYNPDCRIVVITGWNDPEEIIGANMMGVDIWRKPLCQKDLEKIVMRMMGDYGVRPPSSDVIPVASPESTILSPTGKLPGASPG
jgi:ActR/RegA family two-component response regulator